jgi:hypothetical protein
MSPSPPGKPREIETRGLVRLRPGDSPSTRMFFFYLDESGNTGSDLASTDQPIHWLVTLGVSPHAFRSMEREISEIALSHFPDRARLPEFEFHGGHIFAGRGECKGLSPARRIALYGELVSQVGRHGGRLFVRGIHKAGHARRATEKGYAPEHPHKLAFRYLVERLDEWLEGQQPDGEARKKGALPVYGLVVADEQKEVGREIMRSFAHWRDRGTGPGYRARDLRYLLDTVHHVPSRSSWLIQLVDCIAYLRNRCSRVLRESGPRERDWTKSDREVVRLWREHCRPHVESAVVWPGKERRHEGEPKPAAARQGRG